MDLKSLVRINDQGLVADAVNFDMMEDSEKNLSLCRGFVFNYDQRKPKESTVGVLDCLRQSFFSRNEPNVHLMVQDYGKGKSHFALVIANFFRKPADSPEVQGILHQLDLATSGKGSLAEDLRIYKQKSRAHFVIRISGDKETDLRQMFLRSVRRTLEAEGLTNTIAQHLCDRPLQYLEALTQDQKRTADRFLQENSATYGELDIAALIKLLRNQDYRSVQTVVVISRELTNGFAVNFESDVNIEEILESLVSSLCVGESRQYQGIVILFDELHSYLHDSWVPNPARAGGMALQNITNACENHKGQLSLVCFTQVRPLAVQLADGNTARTYQKLATRLELGPSTYEPMASLELVLDALINVQSQENWSAFKKEWGPTLRNDSATFYDKYITIYKDRGWPHNEFFQHLTLGCFPLHPLTSYLLCNLDFTQGRTAVQFIKEDVKQFIANQPVDRNGFPNYIYAIQLVDAFQSNLSNHSSYSDYARAMTAVTASANEEDRKVLKALFLFYVSGSKLHKADAEVHNELVSILTGLSAERVKASLLRLTADLGIIYHIPKNNTYRFYAGLGLADLKKAIENEVAGVIPSIEEVVKYCQSNAIYVFGDATVEGVRFVSDNRLDKKDWTFEIRACSTQAARQLLSAGIAGCKGHGVLAYVVAASPEDATSFSAEVMSLLAASSAKERLIIALPSSGDLGSVARTLLLLKTLKSKSPAEREKYGEAYAQLQKLWEQDASKRLTEAFRSCEFRNPVVQTLAVAYRDDRQEIVSTLLDKLYPFTPPLENVDKLRAGHSTGAGIVTFAVKQLFGNTLSKQNLPNASYATLIDSVLVQRWGLLTQSGSRYSVQEPKDRRVQTAWKRMGELLDLGGEKEKRIPLSQVWHEMERPPYGYNELTFVCLLGSWLVHHRAQVALGLRFKKADGSWASSEVSLSGFVVPEGSFDKKFGKPPKEFLAFFTSHETSFIIRREPLTEVVVPEVVPYEETSRFLTHISEYLNQASVNRNKVTELQRKKGEIEEGVQAINTWMQPILDFLSKTAPASLNSLVTAYRDVTKEPEEFEGGILVKASQEQLSQQISAIEKVKKAVEAVIRAYRERADALTSEGEYSTLLSQVEHDLAALQQTPALSASFAQSLTDVQLAAQRRNEDLNRERALRQEREKVQGHLGFLNPNSSEVALDAARRALNESAAGLTSFSSTREFKEAVEKVDSYLQALSSKLLEWEQASQSPPSSKEAERLRQEVEARKERYDSEQGKARITTLLAAVSTAADSLRKAEEWERLAQRQVDAATALSRQIKALADIPSAIRLFDQLTDAEGSSMSDVPEPARIEISKSKALALADITEKIARLCSDQVSSHPDVNRRADMLSQIRAEVLTRSTLAPLLGTVDSGIAALSETRKRLENLEKDQQILRKIRQVKSASINSLEGSREAIAEISAHIAALQEADSVPADISALLAELQTRADGFCQRLTQVRNKLSLVTSLDKLAELQRDYNQLDLVFRSSELEDTYAALDAEFAFLKEDLERVKMLENAAAGADTVMSVCSGIASASSIGPLLHESARYEDRVQSAHSTLAGQLEGYGENLTALGKAVNRTNTKSEAESLWQEILAQSSIYKRSELEGRYLRVCREAELLLSLLRVQKPRAIMASEQDCAAALQQLDEWQSEVTDGSPALLQRALAYKSEIVSCSEEISAARRQAAHNWVISVVEASTSLFSAGVGPTSAPAVGELLERLSLETPAKIAFLDDIDKVQLGSVREQCESFLESDRESKILFLLCQMPLEKQEEIVRRLARALNIHLIEP